MEKEEQSRHYNIICLTVTTIATAALGAVIILTDLPETLPVGKEEPLSPPEWASLGLASLATLAYLILAISARITIFHRGRNPKGELELKRRLTSRVFDIFIGIATALALFMAINVIVAIGTSVTNNTPENGNPESGGSRTEKGEANPQD